MFAGLLLLRIIAFCWYFAWEKIRVTFTSKGLCSMSTFLSNGIVPTVQINLTKVNFDPMIIYEIVGFIERLNSRGKIINEGKNLLN